MSKNTTPTFAFPIFGIAQVIFLVAKCFGYINWAWWQVLLPTIIPLGVIIVLIIAMLIISMLIALAENKEGVAELKKWGGRR